MFTTKRVVALSLAVALIAGTLGVLVGHTQNNFRSADNALATNLTEDYSETADNLVADLREDTSDSLNNSYYDGYQSNVRYANEQTWSDAPRRTVVRRTSWNNRQVGYSDSQVRERVYYAPQPKKRSFWQKHRDKLTVGIGAGTGALIGGLLGGKKWALIGAGIGGGGAALYTYKLRKRSPRN